MWCSAVIWSMCCSFQNPASASATCGFFAHVGVVEFAQRGLDHRGKVGEVAGLERDLGRQRDAILVHGGLSVVALQVVAEPFHQPRVRVGQVDLAFRALRRLVRIGLRSEAPAVLHPPGLSVVLVGVVAAQLRGELFLEPQPAVKQPLRPAARDR